MDRFLIHDGYYEIYDFEFYWRGIYMTLMIPSDAKSVVF